MLLLQFSTSQYCRKARLALGYKQIPYRVQNLTPGLHALKLKPLTGTTTVPVLLPEVVDQPPVVADSSYILKFLETLSPEPSLYPAMPRQRSEALMLEDWLDESIGIATRFVYYHYRSGPGKQIDPSPLSQMVIQIARWQQGINAVTATLAAERLSLALQELAWRWQDQPFLVGDRMTVADITAAGLLSPLALIPDYRQIYPWLFERISQIHQLCNEPLPPGLLGSTNESSPPGFSGPEPPGSESSLPPNSPDAGGV
jgi:glutathione S-transferase